MSLPITPILFPAIAQAPAVQSATSGAAGGAFQNVLQSAVQQVESSGAAADKAVQGFISGQNQELHSTILATQQADLQFEMFLQARNKVVSAYEEIMRMQV